MPAGRPKTANPFAAVLEARERERQAVASVLRPTERLADFCETMDPTFRKPRHIGLLIDELEAVERGENKRLIVMMPPRSGKTQIISKAFPAYFLGRHPRHQVILTSYGAELAEENSNVARSFLMDEAWPFPDVSLSRETRSVARWKTNRGGICIAAGLGGAITGRGADLLLVDDYLKNPAEAKSDTVRQEQWDWWQGAAITRLMYGGAVVICATRWHEDDLIGRILEQPDAAEWRVIRLPLIAEEGEPDALGRAPGEFLWEPHETPFGEIPTAESVGRQVWASQYQQRPVALQGNLLTEDDLCELPATFYEPTADEHDQRSLAERLRRVHTWDVAFSESDRADWTVGISWGIDSRMNLYVLGVRKLRVATGTAAQPIAEFWEGGGRPPLVILERPAFRQKQVDALAAELRTRIMASVVVQPVSGEGDKEDRFGLFVARAKEGTVYVDKKASWYTQTWWPEVAAFPKGRFDDVPDATSLLCVYLNQHGMVKKPTVSHYQVRPRHYGARPASHSRELIRDLFGGVKR